jgi:hypothetical protein
MEHQAINIYQTPAARAFDLGDRFGELRMLSFFDERYASHKQLDFPTLNCSTPFQAQ